MKTKIIRNFLAISLFIAFSSTCVGCTPKESSKEESVGSDSYLPTPDFTQQTNLKLLEYK